MRQPPFYVLSNVNPKINTKIHTMSHINLQLLSLSLLICGFMLSACDSTDEPPSMEPSMTICPPLDPECALKDADGDGFYNGIDDFPLDSRCYELSNTDCSACGVGCARGLFCKRNIENGLFVGGVCEVAELEVCNQADDDGDQIVDEGPPADNQRGVCGGALKICGPSGGFIDPNYTAISNYVDGGELCDNLDNDCDGLVDEAPRALKGLGVCQGLHQTCVGGAFQEPNYSEVSGYSDIELCDGEDNDCDGEIDEEIPGVGVGCGAGVGACFEEGETICKPLEERIVCNVGGGSPRSEACNGRDDDCDGRVDEQLANTGMACIVGQGICAVEGRLICADDTGVLICDATPHLPEAEVCNGIDDDCDGNIDEESMGAGEGCQVGIGACARFGIYECDLESHELICSQEPSEPIAEVCNAVDDDCDGRVDEEIPTVGEGCSIGEGRCLSQGVLICAGDQREVLCNADEIAPVDETCNNEDDDCDGEIDEEAQGTNEECEVGEGICRQTALYRCDSERELLVCDAIPTEGREESCNTLDDDCDGVADEGGLVRTDEYQIEWICVVGGDYMMGWNERLNERPIHPVSVSTFEMARTEVSVAQYLQCVLARDCETPLLSTSNWNIPGRASHPINHLNWNEANNFAQWVGGRLPTEAEWEFVARNRGSSARYPWGEDQPTCEYAIFTDPELGDGCGAQSTAPICSVSPMGDSPLGFCDLSGNVWEWTQDGYVENYNQAPQDGSAVESESGSKVLRGGAWRGGADSLTTTYRLEMSSSVRFDHIGIRLARTVTPED